MSSLAFFPWFTVSAPASVGPFRVVPHRVGASLEAEPRLVDAILSPYQEPGGGSVESATVVHVAGRAVTADLHPEEQARLHRLAEAVAFAALARRGFFETGPYLSRDHLTFTFRRFSGSDPRTLHAAVRRRDGRRFVAHGAAAFRATRPPHAPRLAAFEPDWTIASALLEAFESSRGAPLLEAVSAFNAANGDGDVTSPGLELLWLIAAFEKLLGSAPPPLQRSWGGGRGEGLPGGKDLPLQLTALLDPLTAGARVPRRLATLQRLEASVEPAAPPSASIVEAWARDLIRARRPAGAAGRGATYWGAEAHLIVGAHAFPAAVLARLAADGLRRITDADRKALLSVPYLASLRNPFARRRSLAVRNPYLWQRALEVAGRGLAVIQLTEVLERTRAPGG